MNFIHDYSDDRLRGSCVYCGGPPETGDHTPSRVLLDDPFPSDYPKVSACYPCNQSFSQDEEYVACFLEAVITGSASPTSTMRPKIQRILTKHPSLAARIDNARSTTEDGIHWEADMDRVYNVVLKLAQGHAAYELSEPILRLPEYIVANPRCTMTEHHLMHFERPPSPSFWPEVGSRALQRIAESWPYGGNDWIVVQPGRYRILTHADSGPLVRIVLSEYLGCEVRWSSDAG